MMTWLVNLGGAVLIALIVWWFWVAPAARRRDRPVRPGNDD